VVPHMRKRNLTFIIGILFMIFHSQIFAQETEMEKKISELFFGLNLNQKPSEIVKESDFEFEYGWTSVIADFKDYSYTTEFKKHPTIKSEIKEGTFSIGFGSHDEKYGIFGLSLVIRFTNEYDQIDEYEKLKTEFEKYSSKTIIETTQNEEYEVKSEVVVYQNEKDSEIPKISFYFDQSDKNDFPIVITFSTSWKMEELRKLIEKQKKME
ncbi:hypothetical protein, partial [Winogradskyella endarachnes]